MGEEKYRTHINTLKEMILDEEKLVTYVSISKEYCIHVNESKSLMTKVVEEIRKTQPATTLNVNYIISGLADDNKARTFVCSESDATEYRNGLKLLFFDHIYSINKGKPCVDKVAFMAISTFEDYQLCSGLVKSNECSKRTSDEIGRLKVNSQMPITDQNIIKPPPKKIKEENTKEIIINGQGNAKVSEVKPVSPIKQEKTSPRKEHVNGNKQKPEVKNNNKSQKGIAGFFSRSDSVTAKKSTKASKNELPKNGVHSETENSNIKSEQMDVDEDIVVSEPVKPKAKENVENTVVKRNSNKKEIPASNNKSNKKETPASNNKSKNNEKSLTQIKKNAKVDKKRKRVLHISDSESDEDKNDPFQDNEDVLNKQINIDSEDEIPPTPAANTIKVASNMLNPRKRRKIVNKTYTDEDGYILTKKEEVYESMSENEDSVDMKENIKEEIKKNNEPSKEKTATVKSEVSPNNKKNGPKNNKKKISPPQKGKQSTLMSFFKKA